MPKRERTPEQIQADKERMARVRAARDATKYTIGEGFETHDLPKIPNVPRPDFVDVFRWNRWLRDNGFEVEE